MSDLPDPGDWRSVTQVVLEGTEQDRIEALVAEFDLASRGPLRDNLSGEDLETVRLLGRQTFS
jgi:hypothetical protein